MLTYLRIQNFALIENLELDLGPGLTVLTGETGAGKSIILAAVNLLLGQRAAADLIRTSQEQAVVEAAFRLPQDAPARARLEQAGLDLPPGEDLVVRRLVSREGRNRVQVAGSLSTLGFLAELGPELVSLVGQHSQQALLSADEHLWLLDAFAGLEQERQEVAEAVSRARRLERQVRELEQDLARRQERRAWLTQVIAEIEAAELDPAEEEALKQERRLLANAEQMTRLAQGVFQGLYAAEEGSVLEPLGKVRGLLAELVRLDERLKPLAARLEEAFYGLEDIAQEMRDYAESRTADPARLDWLEGRLLAIQRLGRKHGGDVAAALETLAEARRELESLDGGQERLTDLAGQRQAALDQALELARGLGTGRRAAAPRLAAAARAELAQLGMAACEFEVRFNPPGGPALATSDGPLAGRGLEEAEFYIAPNPGEGFRKLSRIASGGELSRLLLALKGLVAAQAGAATMIFDEVDAGIGGATGSAVGRRLKALSRGAQVLCISHLPQIAAWGDHHLTVGKQVSQGRTATVLATLDEDGRLREMTRMLGGDQGGQAAREHALEMLGQARQERP
ncbi:MAG: DNA repair protein RecN [Pseudomonadota bacterium]